MAATWKLPTLGTFKFNGGWEQIVDGPAYDVFSYRSGLGNDRPPNGKYQLSIEAANDKDLPTPEQIAVAEALVVHPTDVVALVTGALWEEFNGRGPDSGMWWYGALADINESIQSRGLAFWGDKKRKPPLLTAPSDLLAHLRLSYIYIWKSQAATKETIGVNPATGKPIKTRGRRYRPVAAELGFSGFIEHEHGIGVLTDGRAVLGTGYSNGEAEPYASA